MTAPATSLVNEKPKTKQNHMDRNKIAQILGEELAKALPGAHVVTSSSDTEALMEFLTGRKRRKIGENPNCRCINCMAGKHVEETSMTGPEREAFDKDYENATQLYDHVSESMAMASNMPESFEDRFKSAIEFAQKMGLPVLAEVFQAEYDHAMKLKDFYAKVGVEMNRD